MASIHCFACGHSEPTTFVLPRGTPWSQACRHCGRPTGYFDDPPAEEPFRSAGPSSDSPPAPPNPAPDAGTSASDRVLHRESADGASIANRLRERWFAWRTSRDWMRWHARVRREEAALERLVLYRRILMRRLDIDTRSAEAILRRARQSISAWDSDREITFRDVVLYVVVDEYLRDHAARLGAEARLERIVHAVVPREL